MAVFHGYVCPVCAVGRNAVHRDRLHLAAHGALDLDIAHSVFLHLSQDSGAVLLGVDNMRVGIDIGCKAHVVEQAFIHVSHQVDIFLRGLVDSA